MFKYRKFNGAKKTKMHIYHCILNVRTKCITLVTTHRSQKLWMLKSRSSISCRFHMHLSKRQTRSVVERATKSYKVVQHLLFPLYSQAMRLCHSSNSILELQLSDQIKCVMLIKYVICKVYK